jgi:hypothetical protein
MKSAENVSYRICRLGLGCTCLAEDYSALAAQGYRWVTVNGPYSCTSARSEVISGNASYCLAGE